MNNILENNTIKKIIFFITGLTFCFPVLTLYYLFENKGDEKIKDAFKYMKYGAIAALIIIVLSILSSIILGFILIFELY